jgi:hypothetical protein
MCYSKRKGSVHYDGARAWLNLLLSSNTLPLYTMFVSSSFYFRVARFRGVKCRPLAILINVNVKTARRVEPPHREATRVDAVPSYVYVHMCASHVDRRGGHVDTFENNVVSCYHACRAVAPP